MYNCARRAPNIIAPAYHRLLCQDTHNREIERERERGAHILIASKRVYYMVIFDNDIRIVSRLHSDKKIFLIEIFTHLNHSKNLMAKLRFWI